MNRPEFAIASLTDTGRTRSRNEDALLVRSFGKWTLLCVADGLGGHERGDWASARATEVFAERLEEALSRMPPEAALRSACAAANESVYREAMPQAGGQHSATTLVAALVSGHEVWWLNVGDSRLYLHSTGTLRQVSEDHSWVAERVREGALPAMALRTHPRRNIVSRTVGFEPAVEPDTGSLRVGIGDTLLLCSDGLFGPLTEQAIADALSGSDLAGVATSLVDLANHAGGPDNITVVLGRPQP